MSKFDSNTKSMTPEAIVEQLNALGFQIPEFVQLPLGDRKALSAASRVNAEFVQATIDAVGASPNVQAFLGASSEQLRAEAIDAVRWTSVENELRTLLKGVEAANLVRRHRIGLTALQTYNAMRQLARKKEYAYLLPRIAEMQRMSKFARKRVPSAAKSEAAAAAKPAQPAK